MSQSHGQAMSVRNEKQLNMPHPTHQPTKSVGCVCVAYGIHRGSREEERTTTKIFVTQNNLSHPATGNRSRHMGVKRWGCVQVV